MPFIPLRKRADQFAQALGCGHCGTTSLVLHHYTNQGGIKSANTSHGFDPRFLSKEQDFSVRAFCAFSCFEQTLAKALAKTPKVWLSKRPF